MQIMIEISEDDYQATLGRKIGEYSDVRIIHAIRNGIPLPKEHGKLIDVNSLEPYIYTLYSDTCHGKIRCGCREVVDYYDIIHNVIPIIGADKEINDANCN